MQNKKRCGRPPVLYGSERPPVRSWTGRNGNGKTRGHNKGREGWGKAEKYYTTKMTTYEKIQMQETTETEHGVNKS